MPAHEFQIVHVRYPALTPALTLALAPPRPPPDSRPTPPIHFLFLFPLTPHRRLTPP